MTSVILFIIGSLLLVQAIWKWKETGFGELNYAETMRVVIPGVTLIVLAVQTKIFSFLVSVLELKNDRK